MRCRMPSAGWLVVGLVAAVSAAGSTLEVRMHGFDLDGKHRVIVEERDGDASIWVEKRERADGGPILWKDQEGEEIPARFIERECLMRMRSEVIIPAAPNYFKNAGAKYRITLEGVALEPLYGKIVDVDAQEARFLVFTEIQALAARTDGIYREVLYYGSILAMRALNEARRFPAPLPITVRRSKVGRVRIQGGTLERRGRLLGRETDLDEYTLTDQFLSMGAEMTGLRPGGPSLRMRETKRAEQRAAEAPAPRTPWPEVLAQIQEAYAEPRESGDVTHPRIEGFVAFDVNSDWDGGGDGLSSASRDLTPDFRAFVTDEEVMDRVIEQYEAKR